MKLKLFPQDFGYFYLLASVLTFWLCPASSANRPSEEVWVENGEALAIVVTADEPYPIAIYAARELVEHVRLATGVEMEIFNETDAGEHDGIRIYIGQSETARKQGIDHREIKSEQCVIRSVNGDLFIVGNDGPGHPLSFSNTNAGTLWGVYEVLEKSMGVRWLWPGELGVHVPETERLTIKEWDETIIPVMERRNIRTPVHWTGDGNGIDRFNFSLHGMLRNPQNAGIAYSSDQALSNYVHAQQVFLRRHRNGRTDDPRPYTGHSFRGWWREYGEEHPEWFQKLPEGELADHWRERFGSVYGAGVPPAGGWENHRGPVNPERSLNTSMCVSNPEFQREIVKRWERNRENNPQATIRIGENDIRALCACDDCLALDPPQPTDEEFARIPGYARGQYEPMNAGRRYAIFWKRVHELASEIDPDVVVTAFVYLNYFVAPADVELHENIVLSFCPWGGWWFPRDPREQEWLRHQWHSWKETGATLYYRPNYILNGGSMPHVYARQMAEELQYFYRHGSIGHDSDTLTGQWAVNGTTLYLLSRFHTRPDVSVEELLDEYYTAFGPAALAIKAYFDFWEAHTVANRAIKGFGGSTHQYVRRAHELYPPEAFSRGEQILARAAAAVADDADSIYAERVDYIAKGMKHARKVAELSALFADNQATDEKRREAVEDLIDFRRRTEHLHIANFAYSGRNEMASWGDRFDFNLEHEEE